MKKTSKAIYLVAAILVVAITVLAFMQGGRRGSNQSTPMYKPIEGAKASSYNIYAGVLDIKETDNLIGSKDAPLKIFVYEDYSSPYSAEMAATLDNIKNEYDGRIAIITRPFVTAGSIISRQAALFVLCAQDEGKAEAARGIMFEAAKNGLLQADNFVSYIEELEADKDSFAACLTNEEKSVKLDEVMSEAKNYLVLGAPTTFVGDEMIIGARPYSDFVDSNGDAIEGFKAVVERKLIK